MEKAVCTRGCGAEFAHEGARDFHSRRCNGRPPKKRPVEDLSRTDDEPVIEAPDVPEPDGIGRQEEAKRPMADKEKCPKCGKEYGMRGRGKSAFEAHVAKCDGTPAKAKGVRQPRAPRAAKRQATGDAAEQLREKAKEIRRQADIQATQLEELADQVDKALAGQLPTEAA